MSAKDDIAQISVQEERLVFTAFDEEAALTLGLDLKERAESKGLAVAIDVRTWDRQLFGFSMKGTAPNNQEWIARKVNTVRRFHRASYALMLEHPDGIPERDGMDTCDYAMAGGGFPIRVSGAGVIGCVTVSGLPDRLDHALVVEALCAATGTDHDKIALGPDK